MERMRQTDRDMRIEISRVATLMFELFNPGHDVEQTPVYVEAQHTYLDLQVQRNELYKSDTPEVRDRYTTG